MLEPRCENCNEPASDCTCFDDENLLQVIAYRIFIGKIKTDLLIAKE